MINPAIRQSFGFVLVTCLPISLFSQQTTSFNQNASRSNTKHPDEPSSFVVRLNGDRAVPHSDSIAARGSFLPSLSVAWYPTSFGLAAEYGSFNASPHFDLQDYTSHIKGFTTTDISRSDWKNWFLLFGPSYRKQIGMLPLSVSAELLAGAAKMTPPSFTVKDAAEGTVIADYYNNSKTTTAPQNMVFALKPSFGIEYFPGNGPVGLNIHASYLSALGAKEINTYYRDLSKIDYDGLSQQEVRGQVLKAPMITSTTRGPVNLFSVGAGITIQLAGKGITEKGIKRNASRKGISEKGIKFTSTNDDDEAEKMAIAENGISSTRPKHKRSEFAGREAGSGMATGRRLRTAGNEQQDSNHLDKHSISGRLAWTHSGGANIITNTSAAAGSERQTPNTTFGSMVKFYAREAGSGMATGKRASISTNDSTGEQSDVSYASEVKGGRDAGSGMATGRRQYQPIFIENGGSPFVETIATMREEPPATGNGQPQNNTAGAESILVSLKDKADGSTVATTQTEPDGSFFFDNVPEGAYKVIFAGTVPVVKTFSYHSDSATDVLGAIENSRDYLELTLQESTTAAPAMRRRVEVLKSNRTDEGVASRRRVEVLKSNRSESARLRKRPELLKSDDNNNAAAMRPGSPIGGIVVKGGKNPGGSMLAVQTNESGEFEYPRLDAGDYRFITIETLRIEDAEDAEVY